MMHRCETSKVGRSLSHKVLTNAVRKTVKKNTKIKQTLIRIETFLCIFLAI